MGKSNNISALVPVEDIYQAKVRLQGVAEVTPFRHYERLSEQYDCNLYMKREDLQVVRSYKIRGAYNKMATTPAEELKYGIVCASAGNHAQGVALACAKLGVKGKIFMPAVTPQQKVDKVKLFGREQIEIVLVGDTFDDAYLEAIEERARTGALFVHPFDDLKTIEGQGTVGLEILEQADQPIDYLFVPVGGGGLVSGVGSVFKRISPQTKIIGVEPQGAPAMHKALAQGEIVSLEKIDNFVDGAAVKKVGMYTLSIAQEVIHEMTLVPEGKVCQTILQLYNEEGIVVEPAGALTIAALDFWRERIRGKNVVCILSGSNNDITRTEEIKERALLYAGLKYYFIIRFPQRAGALRDFLNHVLGPDDDITHFEYTKKHNRETGPALVGLRVPSPEAYQGILHRLEEQGLTYQTLNDNPMLFDLLV